MTTPETPADLVGKLLVAMPGMGDPRFEHSVVFLCAHSDEGAMGIIVNKRLPSLSFDELLEQLEIDRAAGADHPGMGVHFGGPVESGRGFVLHTGDWIASPSTMQVDEGFAMTATKDILVELGKGRGPGTALMALGYAGWGPGQLEGEIQDNAWLTVDADQAIVFGASDETKWARALGKLGIDPSLLSASGGRA